MPAGWPPPPGWPAKAADEAPHIILFPERAFDEAAFLAQVRDDGRTRRLVRGGRPAKASATADGSFVADAGGGKDAFGHTQLGGVASHLAGRVKDALGYKVHWTLPDYLQRSARHIASQDRPASRRTAVGRAAVEYALAGQQRGDAGDRAHVGRALSLEDRGRAAGQGRQPREDDAGRLHPQGRLRHHRGRASLPGTADPGRGAAAVRPRTACPATSPAQNAPVPKKLPDWKE